jgi:hypothetical protein
MALLYGPFFGGMRLPNRYEPFALALVRLVSYYILIVATQTFFFSHPAGMVPFSHRTQTQVFGLETFKVLSASKLPLSVDLRTQTNMKYINVVKQVMGLVWCGAHFKTLLIETTL